MKPNITLGLHIIITILFVIVFYHLLAMKQSNIIYYFWSRYIMNRYCFILYILLSLFIFKKDSYIGILLLVLAIGFFKTALKEYFQDIPTTTISETTIPATTTTLVSIPTKIENEIIIADISVPTITSIQNTVDNKSLIDTQFLGMDDRFKIDDVIVRDILRQIKSQIDYDPYKTNLDKEVIYEIYNKYFNNDIFTKLKQNNDDSASYLAAGNFTYVPTVPKVDYDLVTYQNLSNNIQYGINPLTDGIANKTKINRG